MPYWSDCRNDPQGVARFEVPISAQKWLVLKRPVRACDPRSIEYGVRQFLADKVMGNLAGIWLLVPELLRLGAWDLVCGWIKQKPEQVNPRLALQLIHEAALCRTGLRHRRTLNQRIFELASGYPRYQAPPNAGCGRFWTLHRRALGPGQDGNRLRPPGTDAISTCPAIQTEGIAAGDVPAALGRLCNRQADLHPQDSQAGPFYQYVQRQGERSEDYRFNASLSTRHGDEVEELTREFPKRWHVEEFFNAHQALGWKRAGTCNLNIRYGRMTMALLAQASIDRLRKRLISPAANWDAEHMATAYFTGPEGDVRVDGNTILVTYHIIMLLNRINCEHTTKTCRPSSKPRKSTRGFLGSMGLSSIFVSDNVK
jgi:hypothetical protein